jgi:hypothetical protein
MEGDASLIIKSSDTVLSTWFVSDDESNATYFPQVDGQSDKLEVKKIYWRCVACFFASSVAVNEGLRHVLFTNSDLPIIDGVSLEKAFKNWSVEVVRLPITFRLPKGRVKVWGNQFYILDIIEYLARNGVARRYIVLDSDCIWIRSVARIEDEIDRCGVLTYEIDESAYRPTELINGLSRSGMAQFMQKLGADSKNTIPYCGGEIFAATGVEIRNLAAQISRFWPMVLANGGDAPKEEAHLLSILYAINNYQIGTANKFIKRMWTTFKHNNISRTDAELTIWHLPSEKKTGFKDLFESLRAANGNYANPAALGFEHNNYGLVMGIPTRTSTKFLRDLKLKLIERIKALN